MEGSKVQKWSVSDAMRQERRATCYAVMHSRHFASHATQQVRAEAAEAPMPAYIPCADKQGANNVGRVWKF